MAITAADIKFYLSGGAGNSDVNASLGGARSTSTQVTSASLHNLFAKVTGDEGAAGSTKYRCIYVRQEHGTLTWEAVKLWISAQTPSAGTTIDIALGGEGVNGTAETVANENTAPSGETFSAPSSKGAGLSLGNLAPNDFYPIWIRRTVTPTPAALDVDNVVLSVEGDTAA